MIVVIMGVTGSGKTTVGTLLAQSLGWEFADADNFHSPANVEKIRLGIRARRCRSGAMACVIAPSDGRWVAKGKDRCTGVFGIEEELSR